MAIDLSKVQLPTEDADKPAQLDNLNPEGDETEINAAAAGDEGKQPETPPAETKLGATEGEDRDIPDKTPGVDPEKLAAEKKEEEDKAAAAKKAADEAGQTDEEKKAAADAAAAKEKEDKDKKEAADKDTDPEKERVRKLELDNARLEGKLEAMEKSGQITKEEKKVIKSAAQIAEEKVLEKQKGGWEPKDALELNRVYGEELEKALGEKREEEKKELSEREKLFNERKIEIQKQVDDTYTEIGITDQKEKDKVAELASKWASEGTANWSLGTLKLAAEHLKLKGDIGKPKTPEPKPKADPTPENKTQTKIDVNKKISRPTNEGGSASATVKKSISDLRRKSLDDIVLGAADVLG
jgi:hypothetical protein